MLLLPYKLHNIYTVVHACKCTRAHEHTHTHIQTHTHIYLFWHYHVCVSVTVSFGLCKPWGEVPCSPLHSSIVFVSFLHAYLQGVCTVSTYKSKLLLCAVLQAQARRWQPWWPWVACWPWTQRALCCFWWTRCCWCYSRHATSSRSWEAIENFTGMSAMTCPLYILQTFVQVWQPQPLGFTSALNTTV